MRRNGKEWEGMGSSLPLLSSPLLSCLMSSWLSHERIDSIMGRAPLIARVGIAGVVPFVLGRLGVHWLWMVLTLAAWGYMEMRFLTFYGMEERVKGREEKYRELNVHGTPMFPDAESMRWFNDMALKVWRAMGDYLGYTIQRAMQPTVDYYKPPGVHSIGFKKFDLGTQPPVLDNMKMYHSGEESVILLDVDAAWRSDMQAVLVVKLGGKMVGISLPIALNKLTFTGKIRLELHMVSRFPWAGDVFISLLETPHVDFCMNPLKTVNVMELPGIKTWLNDLIVGSIAAFLVHPQRLHIALDEWFSGAQSQGTTPEIEAGHCGVITVHLRRARNLIAADRDGFSDPYVVAMLGGDNTYRSNVIKKTLDPEWDETFQFMIHDPTTEILRFELLDKDVVGADDPLGFVELPVERIAEQVEPHELWLQVQNDKNQGELNVNVMYEPLARATGPNEGEEVREDVKPKRVNQVDPVLRRKMRDKQGRHPRGFLEVFLYEGADLVAADAGGTSDPYCDVTLGEQTFRSASIPKTLSPRWLEQFEFLVFDKEADVLSIKVFDEDFLSCDSLGFHYFPLSQLKKGISLDKWVALKGTTKGKIRVAITYTPFQKVIGSRWQRGLSSKAPYKAPAGRLEIQTVEARDLVAADSCGTSDPYCLLICDKNRYKTGVVKKTLNPVWNGSFHIPILDPEKQRVVVEVYDEDFLSDDFIGRVTLAVTDLRDGVMRDEWYTLTGVPNGEIHLVCQYVPLGQEEGLRVPVKAEETLPSTSNSALAVETETEKGKGKIKAKEDKAGDSFQQPAEDTPRGRPSFSSSPSPSPLLLNRRNTTTSAGKVVGELDVWLYDASNLISANMGGASDPYALVRVGDQTEVRSRVNKKTTSPFWNECFRFFVHDPTTEKIKVTIMSKNTFLADDFLGTQEISFSEYLDGRATEMWVDLEGTKSGKVHLGIRFHPSEEEEEEEEE